MYRHIHNTLYRNLADQSEIGYIHEMSEKKCYRGLFIGIIDAAEASPIMDGDFEIVEVVVPRGITSASKCHWMRH